jgi:C4-dicarboxylate transporter DctQ subunit
LSRFDRALTVVENVLAASALALATLIAIVAVILRTFFNEIIFWSEEAIIYLVIYSTFLGAVITLRHNEHVNVDLLPMVLKGRARKAIELLGALALLVYLALVGYFAWVLITEPVSRLTVTPSLKLPLWVVELALPIGFTLMLLRTLEIVWRLLRGRKAFPENDSAALVPTGPAPSHPLGDAGLTDEPGTPGSRRVEGTDGTGETR